jgi:predicted AAA+ superfamily ATPase
METVDRLLKMPEGSFFLFGPRGTGKSTWLNLQLPDALLVDLLSDDTYQRFLTRPDHLYDLAMAQREHRTLVIDEVQKVPALLSVVHRCMEHRKDLRFVLTGSSARKLRRSGVDLLAGRAQLQTCHPFMAVELGGAFSLETALVTGLVPLVWAAEDPAAVLRSYMALYLREEVQMEALVRNVADFSRFLQAISFSHASQLNLSEVSRECEVSRKTVESYVSILEDLLIAHRLPVFAKRAKRQLVNHVKFYLFDCGVFRSLRPAGPLDRPSEIDGHALEGLVFQHLRAWVDYGARSVQIYYWRTKSGSEVDFILYGEKCFVAIEVKNGAKVNRKDLRALKSFSQDFPEVRCVLLYRGTERLLIDGILCLPCEPFLRALSPDSELLPS